MTELKARQGSPTRALMELGRTCAESVLLAADLPEGTDRNTLLAAVRGMGAGRSVVCAAMLAGLLAIGVWGPAARRRRPPANDLLDSYLPPGGPGASEAQEMTESERFKQRFEAVARKYGRGTGCAGLSRIDWGRHDAAGAPAGYPPNLCVRLADTAVEELNTILAAARKAGAAAAKPA